MAERLDIGGRKFGRLRAVLPIGKNKHNKVIWLCKCDCGNIASVTARNLIIGDVKSCGCYKKELDRVRLLKHGDAKRGRKLKLYHIWQVIKGRCYNPKNSSYKYYGKRGINVCGEWRTSWLNFKNWAISAGYRDGLTIDRINKDGDYCPENCQWLTRSDHSKKSIKERKSNKNTKSSDNEGEKCCKSAD